MATKLKMVTRQMLAVFALAVVHTAAMEQVIDLDDDWSGHAFHTTGAAAVLADRLSLLDSGDAVGTAIWSQPSTLTRYGFQTEFSYTISGVSCSLTAGSEACGGLTFVITDNGTGRTVSASGEDSLGSIDATSTVPGTKTISLEVDPYLQVGDNDVVSPHIAIYNGAADAFITSVPQPGLSGSHTVRLTYDGLRLAVEFDGQLVIDRALNFNTMIATSLDRLPLMAGFTAGQPVGAGAVVTIDSWSWKPNPVLVKGSEPACPEGGKLVYSNHFETGDTAGWSSVPAQFTTTTQGWATQYGQGQHFLGLDAFLGPQAWLDLGDQPAGLYLLSSDFTALGTYDAPSDRIYVQTVDAPGSTVRLADAVVPVCPAIASGTGCVDESCVPSCDNGRSSTSLGDRATAKSDVVYRADSWPVHYIANLNTSVSHDSLAWRHQGEFAHAGGALVLQVNVDNSNPDEMLGIDFLRVCTLPSVSSDTVIPWGTYLFIGIAFIGTVGLAVTVYKVSKRKRSEQQALLSPRGKR